MAQHTAVLNILKLNAPLTGTSAKTGRAYDIQDAECVLYAPDGTVSQVGVLMLNRDVRSTARPGWFSGRFAMVADRQTRRIQSVLVGLDPIPAGHEPGGAKWRAPAPVVPGTPAL